MRILITGSRDWKDSGVIWDTLYKLTEVNKHTEREFIIVSGNCPTGADSIAEEYAEINDLTLELHPADWTKHGKAAGPMRNKQMVDLGADVCLVFIKNDSKGATGTANMAEEAGIPTYRFTQQYPDIDKLERIRPGHVIDTDTQYVKSE